MITQIQVQNIKCGSTKNSFKTALLKIANVQEGGIGNKSEKVLINILLSFDRKETVIQLEKMRYPLIGNNNLLHNAKSFVCCANGDLTKKV